MSKNDVKIWQRALSEEGYYSGEIDGRFGPGTRRASLASMNPQLAAPRMDDFAILSMKNQKATRNQSITRKLKDRLIAAVTQVYGAGAEIHVYSGGQDRKGRGSRRTGSVRHDNYGEGGRAADCYIYVSGRKIFGLELAKLGQYWLAKEWGGVGLEMATGGIHLDEWETPPSGGGMFWTYKYSDRKPWGSKVRAMLVAGSRGEFP